MLLEKAFESLPAGRPVIAFICLSGWLRKPLLVVAGLPAVHHQIGCLPVTPRHAWRRGTRSTARAALGKGTSHMLCRPELTG